MIVGYSRAPLILWSDAFSFTPSSTGDGYDGFTIRQVYSSAILTASGSKVRLVLSGGNTGGCTIDAMYIGEQASSGDPYDMKASAPAPTQFLVLGSGSFTVPNNDTLTTDPLTFAFDHTKTYVIAHHINGTPDSMKATTGTSVAGYTKSGVNEASIANVSGYTARPSGQALLTTEIQVTP